MLTSTPKKQLASILTRLVEPVAEVNASHVWAPAGFLQPKEARLGDHQAFLAPGQRREVIDWWLKVPRRANTPNWDLVSQCKFGGNAGLILVEAKAHTEELTKGGKGGGNEGNDKQIEKAMKQAESALNAVLPNWTLTKGSCYQLCNRFAWAWKLASMGIPTILIYLGFLRCDEMSDCGSPFNSSEHWERVLKEHAKCVVPPTAWGVRIPTSGAPMWALIRSLEMLPFSQI